MNIQIEQLVKSKISVKDLSEQLDYFGRLLPIPLAERVNVEEYANKMYNIGIVLLAKEVERIVGIVCFYANDSVKKIAFLSLLCIDSEFQQLRIGQKLLQKAITLSIERLMCFMTVGVHKLNNAIHFYQKNGFVVTSDRLSHSFLMVESLRLETPAASPVTILSNLIEYPFMRNVDLRIKRDEYYSLISGAAGSKARKSIHIVNHVATSGFDTIVTNGAINSNHTQTTALYAHVHGLKTYLVLHTETPNNPQFGDNYYLSQLGRPTIEYCRLSELGKAMDRAMEVETQLGRKPIYLWEGGHCPQGTMAYIQVAEEFQNQSPDWKPDYVVLPSGTGTTQAGLTIGFGQETKVVGISIARKKERGTRVVKEAIDQFYQYYGVPQLEQKVDFRDDWIASGYETFDPDMAFVIENLAKYGVLLDPTYTGKAFRGMLNLVKPGEFPPKSKILFWHTGGLFNLLSSTILRTDEQQ